MIKYNFWNILIVSIIIINYNLRQSSRCKYIGALFCVCRCFLIAHVTIIKLLLWTYKFPGSGRSLYNSGLAGVYIRKIIVQLLEELGDYFGIVTLVIFLSCVMIKYFFFF